MGYKRQNFKNGELLTAEHLIRMEDGILENVGIESVRQTETSNVDGGNNVITVSLTDGTKSVFIVKNGSKGSNGLNGAAGKSAYQYAKDGGYTGTEAEFTEKMAQEHPTIEQFIQLSEDIEELQTTLGTNISHLAELVGGDA